MRDPITGGADRNDVLMFMCKDPKTGKTQKVQCKTPPKQKLSDPDKVTLAELEEVCGIQTGNGFDT